MRTLLALSLAATATAAIAYDPIVRARGWWRVDAFDNADCAGEIGTNGRFYVISASGFASDEPALLTITNGDMKPIERAVHADGDGRWRDYYIPFRPDMIDGGNVTVMLAGETCTVPLAFTWNRAKGWEDPAPLRPR